MGRSKKRSVFRNCLKLEKLEQRQLFAADIADSLAMVAPSLDRFISGRLNESVTPTSKLETVESQAELDSKLKELAGSYWKGVLGKGLFDEHPYPEGIFFINDAVLRMETLSFASSIGITNTRHDSIDESDLADTTSDGFLYAVVGGAVQVVDLRDPSNLTALDVIELDDTAAKLMVAGDSLIVLQSAPIRSNDVHYNTYYGSYFSQTRVSVYDITEHTSPELKMTTVIDGTNFAARLTNGQLTLVQGTKNVLPKPSLITEVDGIQRYESLESYYASHRDEIVSAMLPNYVEGADAETADDFQDVGTWSDLSFANDSLTVATTILRYELSDSTLSLIDSETITGLLPQLVYQGEEDIYLVSSATQVNAVTKSFIYKVDATADGQLNVKGVAEINGSVTDTTWLNEHNGILQVASLGSTMTDAGGPGDSTSEWGWDLIWRMPTFESSANITTVGDTADGWQVLGTLENIADGQSLLSASFLGERAVLTTGIQSMQFWGDPLHGIDLSDPANPVEMSELVIPGFTTFLKQIDETHWIGLGYDQESNFSNSYLQVSLYQVADLAEPVVVDHWTSTDISWWGTWDAHSVNYDSASGILTLSISRLNVDGTNIPVPLLQVDVTAEDALQVLGSPELAGTLVRGFTRDNIYVAITNIGVSTFDVADGLKPLDTVKLANYDALEFQYWGVTAGSSKDFKLADIWNDEPFQITSIATDGSIQATLNADQSITITAPESDNPIQQQLNLTLTFQSGRTRSINIQLYAYLVMQLPIDQPTYGDASGSIQARFNDDAGKEITELSAGDEVWVTVSATDTREFGSGVFAAYVDVVFDSQNVTVVGDLENLGHYSNGKSGTVSDSGIKNLGGFGGTSIPGSVSNDIVRFKIRVTDDQPVTLTFSPSTKIGNEFLVYNSRDAVNSDTIEDFVLTTQVSAMRVTTENSQQDVNSDGVITALDVLQVVNYINARSSASAESVSVMAASVVPTQFDITGDGVISGLDVLQIINTINARNGAPASGEASGLDPASVDQLFAIDLDTVIKRKTF